MAYNNSLILNGLTMLNNRYYSLIAVLLVFLLASCSSDTHQESSTSVNSASCTGETKKFNDLIKASDNGDYQALKKAADMLLNGYLDDNCSKIVNKEKAIEYYEFAASNGNKEAGVILENYLQSEKSLTTKASQGDVVAFFSGKWIDKEAKIGIEISRNGSLSLFSATIDQLLSKDEKIEHDKNAYSKRMDVFHSAKEHGGYWDAIKETADVEVKELIKNAEISVLNKVSDATGSLIVNNKCTKTFGYLDNLPEYKENKFNQFSIQSSLPFMKLECPTETKILIATRGNSNTLTHIICTDTCAKFPELTRNPVSNISIPVR